MFTGMPSGCHQSGVHLSVSAPLHVMLYLCTLWRDLMNLSTYIHHLCGHCCQGFPGQRSMSNCIIVK